MPSEENFFSLDKEEIFGKLSSSASGLSSTEAASRLKTYGYNKLTPKKKISPFALFLEQFQNNLILILIGSAFLVFFIYFFGGHDQSDLIEGGLILAIVLMITLLGFFQEYKAENAIEALKKLLAFKAKVMRSGKETEVDVADLVPGDIVILEEGEKVPADIRLLEVTELNTLEASLTGESTPVRKIAATLSGSLQIADQKNMVFSGTVISSGRGFGIVVRTGDQTEIGKIATSVAEVEDEETPIQKRLDHIGKILGYTVIGICALVFVFIVFFASESRDLPWLNRIITSFIAAIALAVAAIPEGLPAVVTISLALGTQRMLRRNALVRKLNSIETLGSTDVICSDKTGTLTKGEMTVREVYFNEQVYEVTGVGYEKEGDFKLAGQPIDPKDISSILEVGLVCNNAVLENGKVIGDPTEAALLVSAAKAEIETGLERIKEIPFSSERKLMSVQIKKGTDYFVYSKGAPEILLSHCDKWLKGGHEIPLTADDKKIILDQTLDMSKRALRTLGFAYKKSDLNEKDLETGLTFLGLQGMIDPARVEVKPLIQQCNASGIRVIMITGDHAATAQAVANEIGIAGKVLTGAEIDEMSEVEIDKIVEEINIYARVNPNFKMRIVEHLQKHGHIVAMTGDGVNDAPAVKKADIGIAMGITGTDVAKGASDVILLDDNFSTIISAIEEGRGIFDNIRKFVDYLLSCNVGEVLVVFLALLLFQDVILSAVMLLWINIVTDGIPAIALGLDPAEEGIFRYSPKKFQEQIINKRVWFEIIFFGIALTAATLLLFYLNLSESLEEARAAAFIAIVVFELVRLVNIRSDYKIPWTANLLLPVSIIVAVMLQLVIVYVPLFSNWFELAPIDTFDWLYIVVVGTILYVVFRVFDSFLDRFSAFSPAQRNTH